MRRLGKATEDFVRTSAQQGGASEIELDLLGEIDALRGELLEVISKELVPCRTDRDRYKKALEDILHVCAAYNELLEASFKIRNIVTNAQQAEAKGD